MKNYYMSGFSPSHNKYFDGVVTADKELDYDFIQKIKSEWKKASGISEFEDFNMFFYCIVKLDGELSG